MTIKWLPVIAVALILGAVVQVILADTTRGFTLSVVTGLGAVVAAVLSLKE